MANLPVPANLSEADYDAIEGAVMETARGRWFLAEYARRNRHADTTMLLKALDRIEGAMRGERSVEPVERIRFDLYQHGWIDQGLDFDHGGDRFDVFEEFAVRPADLLPA